MRFTSTTSRSKRCMSTAPHTSAATSSAPMSNTAALNSVGGII